MENLTNHFILDIRIPGQSPLKIDVQDQVSVGLDPRNDLVLTGKKIRPKHAQFEKKAETLILHFLGKDNEGFLNSIPMEENKNYILEKGDVVQISSTEIIIRHEMIHTAEKKAPNIQFRSLDELSKESLNEKLLYKENTTSGILKDSAESQGSEKEKPKKEKSSFLRNVDPGSLFSLAVIKIYAMVTDIFLTYMALVIVVPLLLVDATVLHLLKNGARLISVYYPYPETMNSCIKFLLAWYSLSFVQTLIFGTTFGQYLLGLKNYTKEESRKLSFGRLVFLRLKTLFFSVFLFPGQSYVSNNLLFKAIRKTGLVIVLVFALLSPLFLLTFPYNTPVSDLPLEKRQAVKSLYTKTISSSSKTLEIKLQTELSPRFYLLPLLRQEGPSAQTPLLGFQFFDLKTGNEFIIEQIGSISYEDIENQFEYGNPLFSAIHRAPLHVLPKKKIKGLIQKSLMLSPLSLSEAFKPFGIFFGSSVLLKKELLTLFTSESLLASGSIAQFFTPESPLFLLRHAKTDLIYLFGGQGIIVLSIQSNTEGLLTQVFEREILGRMSFDSNEATEASRPLEILEAIDAYLAQDEQTLLTYYINEANKLVRNPIIIEGVDLSRAARKAITQNISMNQKMIKNKTISQSFDALKSQLTSLE